MVGEQSRPPGSATNLQAVFSQRRRDVPTVDRMPNTPESSTPEPDPTGDHPTEQFHTEQFHTEPINSEAADPEAAHTHQYEAQSHVPSDDAPGGAGSSGGKKRSNPLQRHRTAVLTGVVALVAGGLIGGGLGYAVADTGSSSTGAASTGSSTHAASGAEHHKGAKNKAAKLTAGTISAMNGSTWTVTTRKNQQVAVDVGTGTTFGTAKAPEQQSDFAVGDHVAVAGQRKGDTIEAKRVVKRTQPTSVPQAPATPPSQPS